MNIQGWFSLGLTCLISLQSNGLSRVFSSTTIQFLALSILFGPTITFVHRKTLVLTQQTFVGKVKSLLFIILSRFAIAFFPRSKCLLISWLWSPSIVIWEPQKIKSVTASSFSPSICHDLSFFKLSFKPAFPLSFFTLIKRLLVPQNFLPLEWYHLHIWGCWYFSQQSWFQLVIHTPWHFTWCVLKIS